MQFNEDGTVARDFPVKLVKGDKAILAHTESDVVNAEWNGFQTEDGAKAAAAAEKATAKAEKAPAK